MEEFDIQNLKKRYLIWLYKSSKEALDRVERKFTQLEVDKVLLRELRRMDKPKKAQKLIVDFETYIQNKEKEGLALKFENKELKPEYVFLDLKLQAVEKAISRELGKGALKEIKLLYELEMTERILKSTEH